MAVSSQQRMGDEPHSDVSALIPKSHKRTELGTIPKDWDISTIGEIASIKTGTKNTQDKQTDGKYPFFVRSQEVERINSYSYDGEAVLTAGDGVGTGKVFHYIKGRFDVHQRVYRITDFCDRVDGRYFFYQFSTRFYDRIMSMTAKSSVDSVRLDMIFDMLIPMPPLTEQRAIAEALSDVDELLGSLDALIAKKRDVKHGAMDELLTGKNRLPGFRGKWEKRRLGQLGWFTKGRGIKRDDVSSFGVPCIRYGELYTRYADNIVHPIDRIPLEVAAGALAISKGVLLFAGSGETASDIGRCAAYLGDEQAYAGGDIIVFSPAGQDSRYLGYLMNHSTVAAQKARMAQGDAVVHISAANLSQVQIALPPLEEQTAIVDALIDMDTEILALEQRRDKTCAIQQGMMQELLTGRTRLCPPTNAAPSVES